MWTHSFSSVALPIFWIFIPFLRYLNFHLILLLDSLSKSPFTVSRDKYQTENEPKEATKRKLMDLMLELEHIKLEAGYDSDESLSCYPVSSGKTKAVYQKLLKKPENSPGIL